MKKYIIAMAAFLGTANALMAQQETVKERKIVVIRRFGSPGDSAAYQKSIEQYEKDVKQWSENVARMKQENALAPIPPIPPVPPMPAMPGLENEGMVIYADTPGTDTPGGFRVTKRIIIRDMEEGVDQPAETPQKPARVLNMSEMNLGFARVDQTGIGAGMMPELSTARSIHIGLSQDWGLKLGAQGKVRFWAGLRYDILNYRFEDARVRLQPRSNEFNAMVDSGSATSKSKVVVNYLGVPLALGYQSNPRDPEDGFSIKAGVSAGYRVRTHTKVKFENDRKEKEFDDFNFNDFLISPFVQLTYNSFGIYFRMNTSPVFKDGQGLATTGMQFGVVLQ